MTIQLFSPSLAHAELAALTRVIDSNWLGRGPIAAEFERAWAQHLGADPEQCLSITSATEGLFTIFQMILSPGDEVIIPAIHFVGVANAVLAAGGKPVFCDVDKRTLNTTALLIGDRITEKTKAVCVLHYGGYPCEIDEILELCLRRGLVLVEDSANSPASTYAGEIDGRKMTRACGTWGAFGVFSFDSMKIMSTGDGGMLYAQNPDFIQQAKQRLYLGLDETSGLSSQKERWWEFSVSVPGRRGLMNDLTASIGIEQLKKLPKFVDDRFKLSFLYSNSLKELPVFTWAYWREKENIYDYQSRSSYYFYPIQLPDQATRDGLARYLREHDIYTSFRYFPLHRVQYFQHDAYPLPGADYAADRTLLLPLHQSLSFQDVETVCERVKEYFDNGSSLS